MDKSAYSVVRKSENNGTILITIDLPKYFNDQEFSVAGIQRLVDGSVRLAALLKPIELDSEIYQLNFWVHEKDLGEFRILTSYETDYGYLCRTLSQYWIALDDA